MKNTTILSAGLSVCLFSATGVMAAEADALSAALPIYGTYAYSFEGEITAGPLPGPVAASGVIDVHWRRDDPSVDPGIPGFRVDADGERTMNIGGVLVCTNTFECDLQLDLNDAGKALCITVMVEPAGCPEDPETFYFVTEDGGKGFRYVGTTPDTVVLGSAKIQ